LVELEIAKAQVKLFNEKIRYEVE